MSKNTKIIAVVGGILILAVLGYMVFTGGSTADAIGCGKKKGKKARNQLTTVTKDSQGKLVRPVEFIWANCRKLGYIPKIEVKKVDKGKDKGKEYWATVGGKRPAPEGDNTKKATCDCLNQWKTHCADKTFESSNGNLCKLKAAELTKKGCGGGAADDDE
jgi:hypothetical protein